MNWKAVECSQSTVLTEFMLAYSFRFTQSQLSDRLQILKLEETSDSSCFKGVESEGREDVMGLRTCSHSPQTWQLGNGSSLRNWQKQEGFSDCLPLKQVINALSFPQFSSYPLTYSIPPQLSTLHRSSIKMLRFNHFIRSSFPYGGSHVMSDLDQINSYAFLLLICLCQFNFQAPPGNLRGSRRIFFLPCTCQVLSRVPTPCEVLIHDSYYYHHDAFSSTPFLSSQMGLRLA